LKRLAELVDELAQGSSVKAAVLAHLAHEERGPDVDFAAAWSAARAACPPRAWMLGLVQQASTPEQVHVRLHVPDCAGCSVELDALRRDPASLDMQRILPTIERSRRDSFGDT
jgi:hypothetical protein